jgi:hypothetical protein
MGVTPSSGGTMPRYMLQQHAGLHACTYTKGSRVPRDPISSKNLSYHIQRSFIHARGRCLQSGLREIEWVAYRPPPNDVQPTTQPTTEVEYTPTSTADTPPNPPATNDLMLSVVDVPACIDSGVGSFASWLCGRRGRSRLQTCYKAETIHWWVTIGPWRGDRKKKKA